MIAEGMSIYLIYNYITHSILVTDTNGIILDPTEMIVLPNSPMNQCGTQVVSLIVTE